jgi:hypothetical protein
MLESIFTVIGGFVVVFILYMAWKCLEVILHYGLIAIMYSIPFLLFGGGLYLFVAKGEPQRSTGLLVMLFGGVVIYCMYEVWKESE